MPPSKRNSRRRMPDTRAPPRSRSAAPFSLPPPGWQVSGTDLNCSESTGWRGHRAAGREPEACGVTDPVSPRAASPGSGAAICAGSADSGTLSGTRKFFFKNVLRQKGYPLLGGRNRFWAGFRERGHEQFSESKSPPTGGSHLPHAHPSSFEMRRTVPVPTRGAGDGRQSTLISLEVAEPVG